MAIRLRGQDYALSCEMMWKLDLNVDAARKLPKWSRFHRACGERGLFFDNIERRDRRDTYKCVAFTIKTRGAGEKFAGHPVQVFLAEGVGKTVLDALGDALGKAEYDIPEAEALLAAGLEETQPTAEPDDFDALMEDEFEGLL